VGVYLALNVALMVWGAHYLWERPAFFAQWRSLIVVEYDTPLKMIVVALLLFPKLALGLSGFETGVAVMPLVKGSPEDTDVHPAGRIRNTRKLLTTAALAMSVLLVMSSVITTLLIPASEFQEGGAAYGRALAYLAHEHLGNLFGTIYDLSTVTILWFAGASAMVGLLNLVPRYLPRYGMAPEWAKANRPLVLIFTIITFVVTLLFDADVTSQGGAYATGVLVLMGSAALAVTLDAHRRRKEWRGYLLLTIVFVYTTLVNIDAKQGALQVLNGASLMLAPDDGTTVVGQRREIFADGFRLVAEHHHNPTFPLTEAMSFAGSNPTPCLKTVSTLRTSAMFLDGSPPTMTRSACLPTAIDPTRAPRPM